MYIYKFIHKYTRMYIHLFVYCLMYVIYSFMYVFISLFIYSCFISYGFNFICWSGLLYPVEMTAIAQDFLLDISCWAWEYCMKWLGVESTPGMNMWSA